MHTCTYQDFNQKHKLGAQNKGGVDLRSRTQQSWLPSGVVAGFDKLNGQGKKIRRELSLCSRHIKNIGRVRQARKRETREGIQGAPA